MPRWEHSCIGHMFKMICDPDKTWSNNSCFRYLEIVDMLRDGFLTEGTKFSANGRIYVVVKIRGSLKLKMIGG